MKCGAPIEDGTNFCARCGQDLRSVPAASSPAKAEKKAAFRPHEKAESGRKARAHDAASTVSAPRVSPFEAAKKTSGSEADSSQDKKSTVSAHEAAAETIQDVSADFGPEHTAPPADAALSQPRAAAEAKNNGSPFSRISAEAASRTEPAAKASKEASGHRQLPFRPQKDPEPQGPPSIFAQGFPDWSLEPPMIVVRKKRKRK